MNTWTLTETNGNTTLSVTMRYETEKTRDSVLESGMETGVATSYERLDDILASQTSAQATR